MPGDVTVCREYQHEACCTLDTVRKCVVVVLFIVFFFLLLFAVVCAHNAVGPEATEGGAQLSFDLFSQYSIVRSWKLTRARILFFARFYRVPTAMIDALYGDDYNHGLCEDVVGENYPKISEECQAFFDAENCFYECDKNVGKWRRHENCNEEDADRANHNAWEIYKMPIRASTADDMYEACKNDYFPNSKGMWGTEAGGWADAWGDLVKADANGDVRGTCKKGSEIWADGEDMVENVWGEAFKYETDSTKSYVWEFNEGESNPNNKIYEKKPYPPSNCSYHSSIDVDAPSANFPDHCPIDWHLDETSGHDSGAKTVSVAAAYSLVILALLFA